MHRICLGVGHGLVWNSDAQNIVADAPCEIEHRNVQCLRFADDAARLAVGNDGLELGAPRVIRQVFSGRVVHDLAIQVNE